MKININRKVYSCIQGPIFILLEALHNGVTFWVLLVCRIFHYYSILHNNHSTTQVVEAVIGVALDLFCCSVYLKTYNISNLELELDGWRTVRIIHPMDKLSPLPLR